MKNLDQPQLAWSLWFQLQKLSDLLWDAYYTEFLDFCIRQSPIEDIQDPPPYDDHQP